jgi:hypothetical protein
MTDGRTPRTLLISDRLWQAYEQMAGEMSNDREGLINQALFLFARAQGYLPPGVSSEPPPDEASPARADLSVAADDEGVDAGVPTPRSVRTHAITPAPPTKVLVLLSDGRDIDRVLKDRFVIGRGKQSSDLTLKDPNVSRQHAMIEFQNGVYFMVDMGSTNGVEYNGQRIARKQIAEGDVFKICDHDLRFTYR